MPFMRRILVTAALPYANGDIHLGYLTEATQADIWVRFQKMRGHECRYVCADDAHGTPVMLRAESENITPEELIDKVQKAHVRDLAGFDIGFDNYHSTHSEENRRLSEDMFCRLRDAGCIIEREIEQLYDPQKNMFLPDRYVRGNCPRCDTANQPGDSCENCGAAYSPTELKNPTSALSGESPVLKKSLHYFLHLNAAREELRQWTEDEIADPNDKSRKIPRLQKEATNKLREWLTDDLRDWDISRDAPYFGFRIPGVAAEKYFYVWLDAPIGYMASFKNLCDKENKEKLSFDDFWRDEKNTELYHFIGKDILYFHALFWPVMLSNSGYRRPTRVFAHGFLTVNGEKMSKSRGTFITARYYLDCGLNPEWLRYYYACKLNDKIEDIDLNLDDFTQRINGDLVGKLVNIPSRVAGFINDLFDGRLNDNSSKEEAPLSPCLSHRLAIEEAYESRRYSEAIRLILASANFINVYVDANAPWTLTKKGKQRTAEEHNELHSICSNVLRAFHVLMIYLRPVLPQLSMEAAKFLNATDRMEWALREDFEPLPAEHKIGKFKHLMKRVEKEQVAQLIQPAVAKPAVADDSDDGLIDINDFARMDLRVAVVTKATAVEGADKLLHLTLDVGDGRSRSVFAGIKQHYEADDLIGRRIVYLANLRPRKMRFGVSEGMVLAASDGERVTLLSVADGAPAGAKVS